jgi:hypothetical protein
MTTEHGTAQEYLRLADKSIERGEIAEALRYIDKAQSLLLRPSPEIEPAGTLVGESYRFGHLGKVLAAKAEKAIRG